MSPRHGVLLVGLALAVPTLVAYYPPMSDLPLHEGVIGILRHHADPEFFPPDLYVLNLGHPNQLFHLVAWMLSYAVGTRWAVKLVIAVTQVAILAAGAQLSDHLGRSRWGAVLLAPLALGFTYYWGLVANLIGFAAFLWALPILDRACLDATPRAMARVLGVFAVLYLAHGTVVLIALAFFGLLTLGYPLERRRTPVRAVTVVAASLILAGWHAYQKGTFTSAQLQVPTVFTPLAERLLYVPNDLFGSHDAPVQLILFGLAAIALAGLAVARWRSDEPRPPAAEGGLRRLLDLVVHYRFEVTGWAFVVGFLAAPSSWESATLLYARLAGPAWALLAITSSPRGPAPRIAKLAAAVLPIAILLVSWPQFLDSDRTYRQLETILARIPRRSAVLLCRLDNPRYKTRVWAASPGPARVVADRGGRVSLSLVSSPIAPARLRPEYRWAEFEARNHGNDPKALLPAHDLDRFGWVVAQSRSTELRRAIVAAFRPDAELVADEGEWLLLRSTHPQLELTSPDSSPSGDIRETLLDRVAAVVIRMGIQREQMSP
jgi:hypothetical protein